jgi:hypothetical protein
MTDSPKTGNKFGNSPAKMDEDKVAPFLAEIDESALPEVYGHQLNARQWLAFQVYWDPERGKGLPSTTAKYLGAAVATIHMWRKSMWWGKLSEQLILDGQRDFHAKLVAGREKILEGVWKAVDPTNENDRTAMAKVQMAKVFGEMGKEPLINRRTNVEVINNTQVTNLLVNESMLRQFTMEELQEYTLNRTIPERFSAKEPPTVINP